MELLVPADVEVASLSELSTLLPANGFVGVTTAAQSLGTTLPTQDPKPDVFGRVWASGGPPLNVVTDRATLNVEGFARKEQRARDLCAYMIAIIEAAGRSGSLGGATVYRARAISLPSSLPHPQVPTHFRFTAMISVDLRRVTV